MTIQQQEQVIKYRNQYQERCKIYKWYKDCKFGVYENPSNPEDDNITIISTFVSSISNDFLPFYDTIYLLVQPDGNVISLMDVYPDGDVSAYVLNLKLIES